VSDRDDAWEVIEKETKLFESNFTKNQAAGLWICRDGSISMPQKADKAIFMISGLPVELK